MTASASPSFPVRLQAMLDAPGLRKGERTALRIRLAACELLDAVTPDRLRIQELCTRAGIAQGTFYLYFADRDVLLAAVLEEFVAFLHAGLSSATQDSPSPAESVRLATLAYCRHFEANRGLMRCLLQFHESFPKARAVVDAWNRTWIETVVQSVRARDRRAGVASAPLRDLRRRAYALGAMVDQYLAGIYLQQDPNLVAVAGGMGAVAGTLTDIWCRALGLDAPPAAA